MTPTFKKLIFSFCVLASATAARAGSTDGLSIAVIGSETATPYSGLVKQFLTDRNINKSNCGDYSLSLENVYTSVLPQQLTSPLALGATRDPSKRRQLRKILTSYRDKTLNHGFDAALVYEEKGGRLYLYGISGDADIKMQVTNIPVSAINDQQKFGIAACKALDSLPVLAAP